MYSEDDSNSIFARDENSHSLSQVRARRATRLDAQVSLSSLNESSMLSVANAPLGDDKNASSDPHVDAYSRPASPRSIFGAARDVNALPIDVKQRQQMLMTSSSSRHGSRHAHLGSHATSRCSSINSNSNHLTYNNGSYHGSNSRSGLGLRMQNHLLRSQSHLTSVRTLVDGEVESGHVSPSPAPRPASPSVDSNRKSSKSNRRTVSEDSDRETSGNAFPESFRSVSETLEDPSAHAKAFSVTSGNASRTPPPRRAFVLSRLPSSAEDAVPSAPEEEGKKGSKNDETEATRAAVPAPNTMKNTITTTAATTVARSVPRESILLVGASLVLDHAGMMGRQAERAGFSDGRPARVENEGAATNTLTRPPSARPQERAAAATAAVGEAEGSADPTHQRHPTLHPGQVVEEADKDADSTRRGTAGRSFALGGASHDLSSIPSPLPRPVHPTATTTTAVRGSMLLVDRETPTPMRGLRGEGVAPPRAASVEDRLMPNKEDEEEPTHMLQTASVAALRGRRSSPPPRIPTHPTITTTSTATTAWAEREGEVMMSSPPLSMVSPTPARVRAEETKGRHSAIVAATGAIDDDGPARAHVSTRAPQQQTPQKLSSPNAGETESSISVLGTPSARISDEVREIVERAKAEVRRTRESLLSTLDAHRSSFTCTAAATLAMTDANDTHTSVTATLGGSEEKGTAAESGPNAIASSSTRQLDFTERTPERPTAAAPIHISEISSSAAISTTNFDDPLRPSRQAQTQQSPPPFFHSWSTSELRSRLGHAAGTILRRLKGYDTHQHGVLAMETVMKVTLFVLKAKLGSNPSAGDTGDGAGMDSDVRTPLSEDSLAMIGSESATPRVGGGRLRASAVSNGNGSGAVSSATPAAQVSHTRFASEGNGISSASPLSGRMGNGMLGATPGVFITSPSSADRFTRLCHDNINSSRGVHDRTPSSVTPASNGSHRNIIVSQLSGSTLLPVGEDPFPLSFACSDRQRRRDSMGSDDHPEEDEKEVRGRPATRMSPSRTLERVIARQCARAAEKAFLSFYLFVLRAFREVFGERYALCHLGATNASRHDLAGPRLLDNPEKDAKNGVKRQRTESLGFRTSDDGVFTMRTAAGGPVRRLEDVESPIESAFPRLRQHYAVNGEGSVDKGEHDPRRTPPLDVLVYYNTFADSLKKL